MKVTKAIASTDQNLNGELWNCIGTLAKPMQDRILNNLMITLSLISNHSPADFLSCALAYRRIPYESGVKLTPLE